MTWAVLLFPLFLRIDWEIEFPLFIFSIVIGAPLAALSIYISRAVFLRWELLDKKIEINKDSILIENPKNHTKTVFLKDIISFTYKPEWGGRYSSPAILTIKTQQWEKIEFIRFNKCLYEFFKINFVEEKRKITWTWIVFITIIAIIVIYDAIKKFNLPI